MTPLRDPWSVLDLTPDADDGEILAAYARLRRAFRADSPALVSLDCETERRAEIDAIEEAFRALSRLVASPPSAPGGATPARRRGPVRRSLPLG